MTATYNAPDRPEDVEAAFHTYAEAVAYAEEYGGSVTQRGVVFLVGNGADHDRAKSDLKALQSAVPAAAPGITSDIDAAVDRAVRAASDKLRAEFDAERAAWLAEREAAAADATPPAESPNPTFTPPVDQPV